MKIVFKIGRLTISTGLSTRSFWFFKTNKTILFDETSIYEWNLNGYITKPLMSYKSLRLLQKIDKLKRECYYED
jgi:hypothetical protein